MPTLKQVLDAIDQVKHNPAHAPMRDFDDDAGRGRGANTTTFQHDGDEEGDKGVWMSVWVDDVDEMHKHCVAAGLDITFPPTNMPWNVREMHLRHPDGHVFRVGRGLEPKK